MSEDNTIDFLHGRVDLIEHEITMLQAQLNQKREIDDLFDALHQERQDLNAWRTDITQRLSEVAEAHRVMAEAQMSMRHAMTRWQRERKQIEAFLQDVLDQLNPDRHDLNDALRELLNHDDEPPDGPNRGE